MLDLMHRTSGAVDLNIFNKVMERVLFFSQKYPSVFTDVGAGIKITRKPHLKKLHSVFADRVPPVLKVVHTKLPFGKATSIPTFSFLQNILHLISNDRLTDKSFAKRKRIF